MKAKHLTKAAAVGAALMLTCSGCAAEQPSPSPQEQTDKEQAYLQTIASLESELQQQKEANYITESQYREQLRELQLRLDKLTVTPEAPSDTEADELVFRYRVENDKAIITGYSGSATLLTVPSELDGYPVYGIGERAFENTRIAAIALPEGVVSVGWFAFYGCYELVSITLPASVTTIGYAVFDGCPDVSVVCPVGSYAERYARSYGLPYITN